MELRTIIKMFFFAGAVGWAIVNIAGFFMAAFTGGSTMHIVTHAALSVALTAVAFFLRPWHKRGVRPQAVAGDKRVDVLEDEVSDLQRQLHETQRSLDFTEQLLAKKPEAQRRNDEV